MLPPFETAGPRAAEMSFVLDALQTAARLLQNARPEAAVVKPDWTPVTAVDLGVQAALTGMLEKAFPDDVIVGEESSDTLDRASAASVEAAAIAVARQVHPQVDGSQVRAWLDRGRAEPTRRFWTLDPIDGTKGFLKSGQYVTALALIEDGQVVLGGLACPRFPEDEPGGSFALAQRGAGAWMAATVEGPWRRLTVSGEEDPRKARLLRSVDLGYRTQRALAKFRRELGTSGGETRLDCQVKYLGLAAGYGELVVRLPRKRGALRESIWDHACGVLLVEEAGGRCSDVLGARLRFDVGRQMVDNLGVLASNGHLHEAALHAFRRVSPDVLPPPA